MSDDEKRLLDGVRVVELGSVLMVPYAGQILGDLGADVVKIESFAGDPNRRVGPAPHPELSGVSLNLNRNKRSVVVDIGREQGRGVLLRLLESTDILLTNLRPSSLRRARIEYADVAEVRPDIIYCRSHGYSTESSDAERPAYDDVIQSAAGLAGLSVPITGAPALLPTVLADKVCGLTIVYAVLAALHERTTTGRGQEVEVPMFETMLAFTLVEHLAGATTDPPLSAPGYARVLTPHRRPHRTADGWVVLMPYSAHDWRRLWARLGHRDVVDSLQDMTDHEVKGRAPELYARLSLEIETRTTDDWLGLCAELDIAAAPVPSLAEVVEGPLAAPNRTERSHHSVAGDYLRIRRPTRFASADTVRHEAPLIGADTRAVLAASGYTADEIEELTADQVIGVRPPGGVDGSSGRLPSPASGPASRGPVSSAPR